MSQGALEFHDYTAAELAADRVIHIIGVPLGAVAGAVLMVQAVLHGGAVLIAAVAVYVFGLIGMLGSSAAYQLTPPGRRKELLRRLDRAMIFVMIAGTYTPISANVLYGRGGVILCAVQWALAAAGIFVTLKFPRRFERLLLVLYLAMGWLLLVLIHYCFDLLRMDALVLIFAGGVAYSVGAVIVSLPRIKFHNPVWHALILVAASCQYAAIGLQLLGVV
jgi:hemolysin III